MNRPKSLQWHCLNPEIQAAPAKTSPSTFLFLQTKFSKNRPIRRETGEPPSRSISLSQPQQDNRLGRPTPLLVGNTKPQRRANSGPAAGGGGDIFTVVTRVNSLQHRQMTFLKTAGGTPGYARRRARYRRRMWRLSRPTASAAQADCAICRRPMSGSAPSPASRAPLPPPLTQAPRPRKRSRSGQIPAATLGRLPAN
jgi:hypothetical protein